MDKIIIAGGKRLSGASKRIPNRVARALKLAAQGLVDLRTLENAATVANVGINGQPFLLLSGNQVVIQLDNIPNPGAGQQLTYEADFASVNDPVQGVIVMRISFTVKGR